MRSTYVPLRAAGCKGGEAARVVLERMGRFSGEGLQFWIAPNVGRDALTYSSERTSPSMTQLAVSGSSYVGWGYLPSPCLAIGRSTFAAHPRRVVPFDEEDESPFVGLLQVETV